MLDTEVFLATCIVLAIFVDSQIFRRQLDRGRLSAKHCEAAAVVVVERSCVAYSYQRTVISCNDNTLKSFSGEKYGWDYVAARWNVVVALQ